MGPCFSAQAQPKPKRSGGSGNFFIKKIPGVFSGGLPRLLTPLPSIEKASATYGRQSSKMQRPVQKGAPFGPSPWLGGSVSVPGAQPRATKSSRNQQLFSKSHGQIISLLPAVEPKTDTTTGVQRCHSAPLLDRHGLTAVQASKMAPTVRSLDNEDNPFLRTRWKVDFRDLRLAEPTNDEKKLQKKAAVRAINKNAWALARQVHLDISSEDNRDETQLSLLPDPSVMNSGVESYFDGEGSDAEERSSFMGQNVWSRRVPELKAAVVAPEKATKGQGRGMGEIIPGGKSAAAGRDFESEAVEHPGRIQQQRQRRLNGVHPDDPTEGLPGYNTKDCSAKSSHSSRDSVIASELFRTLWMRSVARKQEEEGKVTPSGQTVVIKDQRAAPVIERRGLHLQPTVDEEWRRIQEAAQQLPRISSGSQLKSSSSTQPSGAAPKPAMPEPKEKAVAWKQAPLLKAALHAADSVSGQGARAGKRTEGGNNPMFSGSDLGRSLSSPAEVRQKLAGLQAVSAARQQSVHPTEAMLLNRQELAGLGTKQLWKEIKVSGVDTLSQGRGGYVTSSGNCGLSKLFAPDIEDTRMSHICLEQQWFGLVTLLSADLDLYADDLAISFLLDFLLSSAKSDSSYCRLLVLCSGLAEKCRRRGYFSS